MHSSNKGKIHKYIIETIFTGIITPCMLVSAPLRLACLYTCHFESNLWKLYTAWIFNMFLMKVLQPSIICTFLLKIGNIQQLHAMTCSSIMNYCFLNHSCVPKAKGLTWLVQNMTEQAASMHYHYILLQDHLDLDTIKLFKCSHLLH